MYVAQQSALALGYLVPYLDASVELQHKALLALAAWIRYEPIDLEYFL